MPRYQALDASKSPVTLSNADYGVAGTPSADVLSFQGVPSGTPVPISVGSLPLPSGASSATNQSTMITSLNNILASLGGSSAPVQSAKSVGPTSLQLLANNSSRKKVQIQNQSADYTVWLLINTVSLGSATADNNCWRLLPGAEYKSDAGSIPVGFISAISDAPTGSTAAIQIIES